ncbi:MAG: glycosyltransferase [Mycobacteriales bacterium]|nr:glycosyltransferase [Mycobacteriales bacterium]
MRVLIAHNAYRSENPSGENRVVESDAEMLRARGHYVVTYVRSSDELDAWGPVARAGLPLRAFRSTDADDHVLDVVRRESIDVVHVHNPYPLVGLGFVGELRRRGVPTVQTVHNFRHVCMKGTFFRDGRPCTDCVGSRARAAGVLHGCYRDSRAQSVVMAATLARHDRVWDEVSRFLAVSPFVAEHLVRFGIPASRVVYKPNAVVEPPHAATTTRAGLLFVGRLQQEKGYDVLLDAWELAGLGSRTTLTLAGGGPDLDAVRRRASGMTSVQVLGDLVPEEVSALMAETEALIVPSRWFEGFPRVIVEAFALGTPVLASALGSLAAVVTPEVGWLAPPDTPSLAAALHVVVGDPEQARRRGQAARALYELSYVPEVVTAQLEGVYADACRELSCGPTA